MLSKTVIKNKIIKHYVNADYDTLTSGMNWYQKAYEEAMMLSDIHGVPLDRVVGVIAALSPRNKWARNISDAYDLLVAPNMTTKVCTFNGQKQKAIDIINGAEIESTLKGTKTVNFFNNIYYYASSYAVTIDVWAFRSVDLEPTPKNFSVAEDAYIDVAESIGILPHQLQAVVWGNIRGSLV